MIGVKTRMALFFAVVLGLAGLCVLAVYRQSPEPREKFRSRNLDRTVAEGMRLWNPKAGVDSVRFDACRIEKMRTGKREEGRGRKNGAVEAFARLLPRSFLQRAGVPARSFSGIRNGADHLRLQPVLRV